MQETGDSNSVSTGCESAELYLATGESEELAKAREEVALPATRDEQPGETSQLPSVYLLIFPLRVMNTCSSSFLATGSLPPALRLVPTIAPYGGRSQRHFLSLSK